MDLRRQDGAVTVYLLVIFLVIIALAGTMVDGARLRIGESQVNRAAEGAVMSALAGYLTPLKEDYGLFALAQNDPEQLGTIIEQYMKGTLMSGLGEDKEDYANLFDFSIEDTTVTPCYNLTENEVLRRQIVEFMKYRAPKQIAEDMAGKAGLFGIAEELKKAGNSSKALNRKMELDELLGKLGSRQLELADCVNVVKLFPKSSIGEYTGRSKAEGALLSRYVQLDDDYRKAAKAYLSKNDDKARKVGRNDVYSGFGKLKMSLKACVMKNEKCKAAAESIIQLKEQIKRKLSEYDEFLQKEKGNLDDEFINSLNEELELARESLKADNSEQVKGKAEDNIKVIDSVMPKLGELNYSIDTFAGEGDAYMESWEKTSAVLGLKGKGQYNNSFSYKYLSLKEWKAQKNKGTSSGARKKDMRNEAEKARDELEKGDAAKAYLEKLNEEFYKARPSLKKDGKYPNKITSEITEPMGSDIEQSLEEKGLGDFISDSSAFGTNGGFNEKDIQNVKLSIDNLSSLCDVLEDFLLSARDELYINEYVMGMFTNDVPVIKKYADGHMKIAADSSKDLRLKVKGDERQAYLKHGEVEYVLFGMQGEEENIKAAGLAIGGVRFGLNLAALHKMPEKMREATIIAEAISAGIAVATAGTGAAASAASINAIREVVLAGWASMEAWQDVKYIKQGRRIPLWKDEKTWITDENGGVKAVNEGDRNSVLQTSYHDYLRLFLAVKSAADKEGKLNHIEDIIQYNIQAAGHPGFKLADYNTCLHIDASVSMRYFFLTFGFIPKELKTKGGRHSFNTVLMNGY